MGETFEQELESVDAVLNTWFRSQIANTLCFVRHEIPCETMSINYNFPLHVSSDKIRSLNPDPNGEDSAEDIKIFHYLGDGRFNREDFLTLESLENALVRTTMNEAESVFQRKLRIVHDKVVKDTPGYA